jgi:hypothetical protein
MVWVTRLDAAVLVRVLMACPHPVASAATSAMVPTRLACATVGFTTARALAAARV